MCYDEDKIERILISDISAPSEQFPVALVSENIEVFPESINTIRLRYYKFPEGVTQAGVRTATPPTYAYTTSAGVEVFNSANSVDFELPDHYLDDLVIEIAELAGINLRDQFIHDASGAQQNQVNQKKSY